VTIYLDTNIVVWLAQGALQRISRRAQTILEQGTLLISPIVLIELEYLYELNRIQLPARDVQVKIEHEIGVRVCDLAFFSVAGAALDEKWTRDPFDRMIVAHAKANGLSPLISADEEIRENYPRTVW
jgi:PIN domain nuclease of toxin-antitoxin system